MYRPEQNNRYLFIKQCNAFNSIDTTELFKRNYLTKCAICLRKIFQCIGYCGENNWFCTVVLHSVYLHCHIIIVVN